MFGNAFTNLNDPLSKLQRVNNFNSNFVQKTFYFIIQGSFGPLFDEAFEVNPGLKEQLLRFSEKVYMPKQDIEYFIEKISNLIYYKIDPDKLNNISFHVQGTDMTGKWLTINVENEIIDYFHFSQEN